MRDTVRHLVIDTSALAAAFVPACTDSDKVRNAMAAIFECSRNGWPSIQLYVPAICIAETLGVFDKLRYSTDKLPEDAYRKARRELEQFVSDKHYHQFEHQPKHILAAGLVSPVNFSMPQNRAENGRFMGAADCVIAGMAVLLGHQVGVYDVILVTAETRMHAVMNQARRLSPTRATELGLVETAEKVGIGPWIKHIYPRCINLRTATEADLREALLGWPLPQRKCRLVLFQWDSAEIAALWVLYREVRQEHRIRGREGLLSGPALDDLRTRYACRTGIDISGVQAYAMIADLEKSKRKRERIETIAKAVGNLDR